MAVRINIENMPRSLIDKIHKDLRLKGTKKARIAEMEVFNIDRGDGTSTKGLQAETDGKTRYSIPLVYAKGIINMKGMKEPKKVKYDILPSKFRNDKFCQQEPVFKEAMQLLKEEQSVFLQLHCGWGKTWMAITIAANMGLKTLILVHRTFLAEQFLTESNVIIPGQMVFLKDNETHLDYPNINMFVCTDGRAQKLSPSFCKSVDFIIIDEAKYWCTPTRVKSMLCFNPTHTMGLCAERKRKDGYGSILNLFFGKIIFRKSAKPFQVWKYFTSFTPKIEKASYGRGKINWDVAMKSIAFNKKRNIMIRDICRLRQGSKIMILMTYKEHINEIKRLLEACGESVGTFYGSQKNYKECRILLATYSKAEMGFDDKNLCENFGGKRLDLLILGSFYKEEIEQSAGRVQRTDAPEIIDIVDNHSTLRKHSATRDKWYKSRCGQVMPSEYFFPLNDEDSDEE
tara:strand:- start:1670 stop:3040 length:1371 start_codon:yes stop_codon:yes gene_type:complete